MDLVCPSPLWSLDLTPCNFLLGGYVKSKVFGSPVDDIVKLKTRIEAAIKGIPGLILQNVTNSVKQRCRECIENNGGHLPNVIFH